MIYRWYYVYDPASCGWVAVTAKTTIPSSVLPGSTIDVHIRGRPVAAHRRTVASVLDWIPARRGAGATVLLTPVQSTETVLSWRYRRLPSGTYAITTFGPVDPDLRLLGATVPVRTARGDIHIRTVTRVRERSNHPNGACVVADVRPDPVLDRAERLRAVREASTAYQNDPRPTGPIAAAEADWRYLRIDTVTGPLWVAQAYGAFGRDAAEVLPGCTIAVLTTSHNVHLRTVAAVRDIQPLPGRARITVALTPMDS
ncbi:MAG: hypothetical protein OXC11_10825 [Rhodospirillales bacterium]|nr:hypothetical protein [Rhodospirillales bacterium]